MTIKKKVKSNNKSIIKVKKNKKIRKSSNKKNKKFLSKKKKIIRQYGGLRVPKAPYWMPFFGRQNTGTISSSDRGIVSFINPMGGVKPEQPSIQNLVPVNNPQLGVYMDLGNNTNPTYSTISTTNEDAVDWATNPSYIVPPLSSSSPPPLSSSPPPLPERMSSSIKLNTFDQEIDNLITNIAMRVLSTKSDKSDKSVRFKNNSNSEKYKAKIAELEKKVADLTKPLEEARQKAEAAAATASAAPTDPAATEKAAATNTEFEQYRQLMTELVANLLSKGATMPTVNISPVIQPHFYGNKMIYENSHRDSSEISTLIEQLKEVIANPSAPPPPELVSETQTTIQQLREEVDGLKARLGSGGVTSEQAAATEAEIAKHKQQITDLTGALEKLTGRVETAEKDIEDLQARMGLVEADIIQLNGLRAGIAAQQLRVDNTISQYQEQYAAFILNVEQRIAQASSSAAAADELKQQAAAAETARAAAEAELTAARQTNKQAEDDRAAIMALIAKLEAETAALRGETAALRETKLNKTEFTDFLRDYNLKMEELEAADKALQGQIRATEVKFQQIEDTLQQNKAQIESLKKRLNPVPGAVRSQVAAAHNNNPLTTLLSLTDSDISYDNVSPFQEGQKKKIKDLLISKGIITDNKGKSEKTENAFETFTSLIGGAVVDPDISALKKLYNQEREGYRTKLQKAFDTIIFRLNNIQTK